MGKRSNFVRRERDFYQTPREPVLPLLPHLLDSTMFHEPCAGDGALVDILKAEGHVPCGKSDIEPMRADVGRAEVASLERCDGDVFITNPPWPLKGQKGEPTISIARHLSEIAPTWLLLSADFAHNVYFNKLSDRCLKIVAVGRVKWIPDSKNAGKDNCAWYLFYAHANGPTVFIEREGKG